MNQPSSFSDFQETLEAAKPSLDWPLPLQALWWDAKGDWNASHDMAQELHTPMGSRIHAYLHRKEGDQWNADYWYRRAGKTFLKYDLNQEFRELVEANL
ncbi:hypothetical protein GTQ34_02110 [Muricauda sp. JGD-17]|uniref:Uncharacterized protein n=1 Tax=Flagellimonas ochracea TaxID=2696472 RepID=A0A964WW64_9FLAO|nr:hypothetical protein [Allomuricauda ochracea]NAY90701.1 hypothetical protein [Allomuricauda ochracea]